MLFCTFREDFVKKKKIFKIGRKEEKQLKYEKCGYG